MRPPAPLALLLAPLLACFADGGSDTVATSKTASDATTSAGTDPSTTREPTTSTTLPPTSDSSTSAGPTTSDPTLTTDPTTTSPVDNCQLAPECTAGSVEDGGQCDSCGVLRRTCGPDCTWSPQTCELAPETCEYWLLPDKGQQWQRVAVDPNAAFAPKETVLTAVALEPQKQIYALTANNYHVFSTLTKTWIAAGKRDSIFPQIAGQTLYHGTGLTTSPPDVIVTLIAGTEAFAYTFQAGTSTFKLDAQVPCCGDDWVGPNAPPDPVTSVRAGWARLDDPDGWIPGNPTDLCALDPPMPLYGYSVAIGDGLVYPQDIGYCFDFYPPIPYAQFTPFSYPGAPPNNLVGGAAWIDGLYIFRGE